MLLDGCGTTTPEAAAVAEELLDRQILVAHHHDVMVEPRLIDWRESRVIQRLHIDAGHFDADLWAHATDFNHGYTSTII